MGDKMLFFVLVFAAVIELQEQGPKITNTLQFRDAILNAIPNLQGNRSAGKPPRSRPDGELI